MELKSVSRADEKKLREWLHSEMPKVAVLS